MKRLNDDEILELKIVFCIATVWGMFNMVFG